MNQRQLKYFLEVYAQHSITLAAKKLYISPQGISKTISSLEEELGVSLFVHKKNRIQPTEDAARLAIHAQHIIDEYDVITEKLFLENMTIKTLPVYCSYDVPQLIPASFFQDFHTQYPEIRINIKEYPDEYIIQQVESNEVELAIVPGPFKPHTINYTHLCTEPFCLVVNKEHPLAQYDTVPFAKIAGESIVIKDSMSYTSLHQIYNFKDPRQSPNVILETSDVHLIHQMAEDNYALGISLMYLAKKIRSEKIRVIPFQEDLLVKNLYLISNKKNILSSEAKLFMKALSSFFTK
ncbi:MAG: LysR family transcriptional regulator [Lachnospiraceae bacterium]|nr:LysR family transcriptional regulator [Lachnospiraceae bacterium]